MPDYDLYDRTGMRRIGVVRETGTGLAGLLAVGVVGLAAAIIVWANAGIIVAVLAMALCAVLLFLLLRRFRMRLVFLCATIAGVIGLGALAADATHTCPSHLLTEQMSGTPDLYSPDDNCTPGPADVGGFRYFVPVEYAGEHEAQQAFSRFVPTVNGKGMGSAVERSASGSTIVGDHVVLRDGGYVSYHLEVPGGTRLAVFYGVPNSKNVDNGPGTVSVDGSLAGQFSERARDVKNAFWVLWNKDLSPGSHEVRVTSSSASDVNVYGLWVQSRPPTDS